MNGNQSNTAVKCYLRKVRLNTQGYDSHGSYWGIGNPLYVAFVDEPSIDFPTWFLRARDREHAKRVVSARWPKASYFR